MLCRKGTSAKPASNQRTSEPSSKQRIHDIYRPVEERTRDWREVVRPLADGAAAVWVLQVLAPDEADPAVLEPL